MFLIFLIFLMYLAPSLQEWRLIHSDFYQEQISSSGNWEFKETCGNDLFRLFSNRQCETNPLKFLCLEYDVAKLENEFYYPHLKIRIITDIIYIRAKSFTNSVFKVSLKSNGVATDIHSRTYQESGIQTYNKICAQNCGWFGCNWLDDSRIELKTLILDNIVHTNPIFTLSYCFSYANTAMRIGLRNIMIYVQTCHISCLTCNGDTKNNCLTCYQGTAVAGDCKCDEQNSYIHTLTGCTQECNRNYYLSDSSKYCQFDPRIKSKLSYFTSTLISNGDLLPYDPWIFIPDPFYYKNTNLKVNCNGEDMIGYFNNYEMIQLQLEEQKNLKFIRIRVSFYLFGFQTESEMRITVDSYSNGQIIKTLTNYTRNSVELIKFQTSSCSGNNYDFLRIETVLKVYNKSPVIKFFALTKQPTEFWAFKNVTIDYGICKNNCTECETFSRCKICDTGYQLYKGSCVDNCPVHTNLLSNGTCQDYEDEIKNSKYLIKAFYDMNTTFEEVDKVVDNFTYLNDALQTSFTGSLYSFVPEKSVLGGVLVWKSGKFKKTFNSLNPHYQISYRFNVTYGDENPGWFKYQFDNDISNQIYNPNDGNRNSIGDSKKETTKYFSGLQQPHSNPKLDIIFSADTTKASLEDAFMYVSDYFVIVHYCAPFCSSCNGPEISDCTTGNYFGYNSTNYCASNQYLNFDTNTNTYQCINCPQFGCIECQSSNICTRCEYSNSNKLVLDQGTCQCYPSQYLYNNNCLQCNTYCETCFGQYDNQCFTCISEFHRSINQFSCKCIPGYFDDNINLQCFPICGDNLVVDGEDCDDGNNDPYDGCDQCQFTCQESCLNCKRGLCYECKDYYSLTPIQSCNSICGDNVTVGNENCDDGNIYPNDGCDQCKFQCYNHCIDCFQGKCRKCDEDNGYYLTGVNCEPICGDGIIALELEDCDDRNLNPFDFCDSCQINCSEFCEICQLGHCIKCRNGFIYNKQLKLCQPQCGDYNVVGNEECDDNNFAILDGCYNCKFNCQNECTKCIYGKCYDCQSGYQVNLQTYFCEIILDDGILTNSTEICDDQNNNPMDGCFQQQYECQDSCQDCFQGKCIRCKTGWQLNKQNNQCYPICGDGKIMGNEFCDDGNSLIYDQCFQCNFMCNSNCKFCKYGICQECNIGYQLINNNCIELCGDDIQVKEEECETNLVQFDQQCLQCKYYCDDGCKYCIQGICQICHKGFQLINYNCYSICGDKLIVGQEECDDGNQIPFDGCNNCKFECQVECLNCHFNQCLDCQNGFYKKDYYCQEDCGNLIATKNEQCDDGNSEPFDGCFKCNYSCDAQCDICEYGKCYKCRNDGWIINNVDNRCIPFCGDSIIVGYEQCDDGNNDRYDGCYECYFECQNECTQCLEGDCYQCDTIGWILFDYKCFPICGDNLVVGTEQCDDGNDIPYDGCFQCQYQCQEQCTLCQNGICNECNTVGWQLVNHKCQPYCGDKIVIEPYEQCDDGNNEQFDGCYECQFQCQQQCEECQLGKCESCELGWIVNNGICVPYCGDNLIVGNEQCDHGLYQISTCVNCQQICDQYCLECENGICYGCVQGMYLNDKLQCHSQCGDGYTVIEDCDDGNNEIGDGCNSQCKVEEGWVCVITNLFSQCFYSETPKMMLQLLTQNPENEQNIQINFNQPMKLLKNNLQQPEYYFSGNITNLVNDQYNLSFKFITEPSFLETKDIQTQVIVNFFENIEDPILLIELKKNAFISDFSSEVRDYQQQIKLKTPIVLSSSQISASENAQSFNYIVIYFLIGLSFICFLTGSFDVFWNLMDLLQYLSYIKYVNIIFPTNLNIYFEVFKLISLQPIFDLLYINSILSLTDGDEKHFVETKNKFQKDDINGYFFTNFQSTIICFLGLFGFYCFAKISLKILYQFGPYHMSYLGYYPSKLIYTLRQILNEVKRSFYFSSILRMLLSNYYDICFSVFIQLINFNTQDKILTINSYAAIVILLFQILFFIYLFNVQQSFQRQSSLKTLQSYQSLIEGVQYNKCPWTGQYNTILIFKKQLFIFLIVFMQNNGTLQAICVALNQTIFFFYLLNFKPLTQIQEYRKLLVSESILAINTLLFLAYAYKIELSLSIQNFINIGWFHIASFSFILTFSLIYDMKSQLYEFYIKVRKQFSQKQKPKNTSQIVFY